jgi:N utilization substance protein B
MGIRNRCRKFLLQSRYASLSNQRPLEENLAQLGLSDRFAPEHAGWITELGRLSDQHSEEIDEAIAAALENWRLDRLSLVTRLILEQSVAEAWYMGTPVPVVIDEAVELARDFDQTASEKFVNGVLDELLTGSKGPSGPESRR